MTKSLSNVVPAQGLTFFKNAHPHPSAAALTMKTWIEAISSRKKGFVVGTRDRNDFELFKVGSGESLKGPFECNWRLLKNTVEQLPSSYNNWQWRPTEDPKRKGRAKHVPSSNNTFHHHHRDASPNCSQQPPHSSNNITFLGGWHAFYNTHVVGAAAAGSVTRWNSPFAIFSLKVALLYGRFGLRWFLNCT